MVLRLIRPGRIALAGALGAACAAEALEQTGADSVGGPNVSLRAAAGWRKTRLGGGAIGTPPTLSVYPAKMALPLNAPLPDLLAGARATDTEDGDLTGDIVSEGAVNPRVPGAYTIQYRVTDRDGNNATPHTRTYYVGNGLTFVANFNSFGEFTELSDKVPEDTPPERRATVADMFDGLIERGYSAISFHPVTTIFGEVGFPAPPGVNLAAKGYRDAAPAPLPDGTTRMGWVVAEAHLRGLKAFANIQAFSHVAKMTSLTVPGAQPLSDAEIEAVVALLVRSAAEGGYGFDGITGEVLPARWFPIVRRVTAVHGAVHMHDTDRQELGSDQALAFPPRLVWETFPDADILSLEDYGLARLGPNTAVLGVARLIQRPVAIRNSTFNFSSGDEPGGFPGPFGPETVGNMFLFRRVQMGAETFIHFVTWADLPEENTVGLINIPVSRFGELTRFHADRSPKPLFDLVMHLGRGPAFEERYDALAGSAFGALLEWATAAGFEVIVSSVPVPEAAAYLLLTTGDDNTEAVFDLPAALDPLLSATVPVLLVTLHGLPVEGAWPRWRQAFGLGSADWATVDDVAKSAVPAPPIPATVQWKGQTVRYLERAAIAKDAEVSAVGLPADGAGLAATVVLKGTIGGTDGALITRKDNFIFLNGSRLDPDVAYLISDLLQLPVGRTAPGDYWSVVGPVVSAFIGYADGQRVQCRLPIAPDTPLNIYKRDARGAVTEAQAIYNSGAGFEHDVDAGEIIVVTASPRLILSKPVLTQSHFEFTITGVPRKSCQIEASADLQQWTTIGEAVNVTGTLTVSYPQPAPPGRQFYRVRQQD